MPEQPKPTESSLEDLSRLECRTCAGMSVVEGICDCEPVGPHEHAVPCPDCRDSEGQPTGLALPELTEPCPGDDYPDEFHFDHDFYVRQFKTCKWCNNTGRILKSDDSLLVAVRRALERVTPFGYTYIYHAPTHYYRIPGNMPIKQWESEDELAAATEALRAVIGVEHA